jgi:hypothetical protein
MSPQEVYITDCSFGTYDTPKKGESPTAVERKNTVTAHYCITQHHCGWWVTAILGLPNSRTSTLPSLTVAVIKTQIRYLLGLSSGSVASLLLLL